MPRIGRGHFTAHRVYPIVDTKKEMDNLQTIGIQLTPDQGRQLIQCLQAAINDPTIEKIDIQGERATGTIRVSST